MGRIAFAKACGQPMRHPSRPEPQSKCGVLVPKVYATREKPGALTTPSSSLGDVKRAKTSIPSEIKTAVRNAPFLKIVTATQTFPIPFCAGARGTSALSTRLSYNLEVHHETDVLGSRHRIAL
jgi:hypothetical protein